MHANHISLCWWLVLMKNLFVASNSQVLATRWYACPWPAVTSPPACTRTPTLLTTTTWIISNWPPRTSTWRSPSSLLSRLLSAQMSAFLMALTSSLSQIPLLQRAQAVAPLPLSLMASAWSAPAWMKTSGALVGKGSLKGRPGGREHKTWAQYYIRCGCAGFTKIRYQTSGS